MTRAFREITYEAPLSEPLKIDAYLAPDPGEWRVVVFPGTPCDKVLFTRLLMTAPRGLEYVILTRPGFGRGHKKAVTSFSEQVAAATPFFSDGPWGAKKIITLGVSYGGELALHAALEYPEAVKGAVTVAALIDEPHDYALRLEQLGGEPNIAPYVPDRFQRVRQEIAGRRTQIGPLLARLKGSTVPVEVVHGDFDAVVPKSNAQTLMDALGENGRLTIIRGGTHYLELQYPRRLHRAVKRVIDRAKNANEN
jgi:pimeloyl-ACP methyl ester carboxylesterase